MMKKSKEMTKLSPFEQCSSKGIFVFLYVYDLLPHFFSPIHTKYPKENQH